MENHLRSELDRYGDLAATEPNLQIYANNGTVTLSGPVQTEKDRQMVDTVVRNAPGVVAVNDQLQVMYPPTGAPAGAYTQPAPVYTTPPSGALLPPPVIPAPGVVITTPRVQASTASDEAVCRRICDQMRVYNVPPEAYQNVTITVRGGNAYVQGTVVTQQERQDIISACQHSSGIVAVYDQLQVR
jgi:osmotically-inducible protein OsmY